MVEKMDNKRKHYLKLNTLMSLMYEILSIFCGFILPRYILQYYGTDTNGLVSSITQFMGFISLCELGMGAVVPASLYKPLAKKDMKEVSCIVTSAQKFYRVVAIIMGAYVVALAITYPSLVTDKFESTYIIWLILIISISTFAQYFFGITYSLLLSADQKQYVTLAINSITLVLNTIISIVFIVSGYSIHLVKFISSMIFILRPFLLLLYTKKHYELETKVKYTGEPIKQKWNGLAQHLASTVQEKADVLVLTVFSSLANVSIYGVYFMIVNGIRGSAYALTSGMSSLIGNIIAQHEEDVLHNVFLRFEWIMHTVSTLLFSATALLIIPFVKVYTNGIADADIYVVPMFAYFLCLALAIRCIQMPYNVVIQAAGHFKETQMSAIIEPIINITISIILVRKFGLIGVAIGTLISMLYRALYFVIYLSKNILFLKISDFIKQCLVDTITVIIIFLISGFLIHDVASYGEWIFMAIETAFISSVICLAINFLFYRNLLIWITKKYRK